jgi:hypothetical protein
MPYRIEVYEKYAVQIAGEYSAEWWRENMPEGTPMPTTGTNYGYRRTMIIVDTIERPIEIPKNKKELLIRFWSGDTMIVKANYDEFCVALHDVEEQCLIEEEMRMQLASETFSQEVDKEGEDD